MDLVILNIIFKSGLTSETLDAAVSALKGLGFELVGPPSSIGVSIKGSSQLVQTTFGDAQLTVPQSLASWIESISVQGQVHPSF